MLTQTAVRNATWKKAGTGSVPPTAPGPQSGPLDMMGAQMSFPRNAEIYGEGEAADYIYRVVSGAVRTYKVLADGRRQVGGFYLPGDMFGPERYHWAHRRSWTSYAYFLWRPVIA